MGIELFFADATEAVARRAAVRLSRELPMLPVSETAGGLAGYVSVVASTALPRGDVLVERWDDTIRSMGVHWHKDQLKFLHTVRNNAIPGFYGDEWPTHRERVCRAQRISGESDPVMFTTPRRWGKTTAMAGAAACYLLTVPGGTQAIFSTGRRASRLALALAYNMVCSRPEWAALVEVYNQESLVLRFGPNDTRVLNSYPSNVKVIALAGAASRGLAPCTPAPPAVAPFSHSRGCRGLAERGER